MNKEMIDLEKELSGFIGTENYYQTNLFGVKYTDGVKHMAEICNAYWLITAIASHQYRAQCRQHNDFQCWKLTVNVEAGTAELTCDDGNDFEFIKQFIEFTDFPAEEIKFYLCHGVLMLPSEY